MDDDQNQEKRKDRHRKDYEKAERYPGARDERIRANKLRRAGARGAITKVIDELELIISDVSFKDTRKVKEKLSQAEELVSKFVIIHNLYHEDLQDENDRQLSLNYLKQEEEYLSRKLKEINEWIYNQDIVENSCKLSVVNDDIKPEDSISNVGSRGRSKASTSRSSRSSRSKATSKHSNTSYASATTTNSKLKAAARRAALEAKAASLQELHEIQNEEVRLRQIRDEEEVRLRQRRDEEEVRLRQRREQIELQSLIAEAIAEERVFSKAAHDQCSDVTHNYDNLKVLDKGFHNKHSGLVEEAIRTDSSKPTIVGKPETRPDRDRVVSSERSRVENRAESGALHIVGDETPQLNILYDMQRQQSSQLQHLLAQQHQQILSLTLPQPTVPVFSGDPSEYCTFIRAFESLIEAKTFSNSDRLYYLVQYTKGDVQELMRSCLLMNPDQGYVEARRLLKEKFGQSHRIATAYLNKVIDCPSIRADDGSALHKFAVSLTSCKNTLKDIGLLNKIENPDVMRKIVSRLPYGLRVQWRDVVDRISEVELREVNIEDLSEFVSKKARVATHPVFGNIPESKVSGQNKSRLEPNKGSTFVSHTNEVTSNREEVSISKEKPVLKNQNQNRPQCPLCHEIHWLNQCCQFKGKSVDERRSFVRANSLCDNCFAPGHFAKSCKKKSFCRVEGCKKKHSSFLHSKSNTTSDSNPQGEVQGQSNSVLNVDTGSDVIGAGTAVPPKSSTVSMAIEPMKVCAIGQSNFVDTVLVSGSTTFCSELQLSQSGVKGVHTEVNLITMEESNSTRDCSTFTLQACDLNDNEIVDLPLVVSVPSRLPVSEKEIPLQEEVNEWKRLDGVCLPSIIYIYIYHVHLVILIGCHVPVAREPRESDNGGSFANRTMFGSEINAAPLAIGAIESSLDCKSNFIRKDEQMSNCKMEFNDPVLDDSPAMSRQDVRAIEIIENSTELVDGHYNIALPWVCSPFDLPNDKSQALHLLIKYWKRKRWKYSLHSVAVKTKTSIFKRPVSKIVLLEGAAAVSV